MNSKNNKARTSFSTWLEKEMEASQIDSKGLAARAKMDYTYLRKLLKDRKPSMAVAIKLGNALNKPREALIAAGFGDKKLDEDLKGEFDSRIVWDVYPFYILLTWLNRLSIYDSVQKEMLIEIIAKLHEWYLENIRVKKVQISNFLNKANSQLQLLYSAPDKYKEYGIFTSKIVDFVLQQKPPSVYSTKYKGIQHYDVFRIPFIVLGIFNKLEYEEGLQLLCPYVFLPLRILKPTYYPAVNLASLGNLSDNEKAEIETHLNLKYELFMSASQNERDALVSMAKHTSEIIWDTLSIGFEPLTKSEDFYDSKVLYQKDRNIYVFATTSGLFVPDEYYGSMLPSILKTKSNRVESKNPTRLSYFEDGILHGLRTGCKVHYQFDIRTTHTALMLGFKDALDKDKYKLEAAKILHKFFLEPNIEISESVFEEKGSPLDFDWRNWLTLVSEKFVVLSARQPETKKMVHGLLIDTLLFNKAIPSSIEFDSIFDIAQYFFAKGNKKLIKEIGKTNSLKDSEEYIEHLLKENNIQTSS